MTKFLLHLFCLVLLLATKTVTAQESSLFGDDDRFFIETDLRQGHYIPFVERHAYIKDLPQYGIDLKFGKQTDGTKNWEQWFNYPNYGVILRYEHNTLDSAKYEHRNETGDAVTDWVAIGDCYTAGAFVNGHIIRQDLWSFDYDLVGGFSFWPDYGNEFIGSLMNVHLSIDAGPTLHISDNVDLLARVIFSHSSNGALVLPNNGVNVFSGEVGLRYHPQGRPEFQPKSHYQMQKTMSIYASESFGALQSNTKRNGEISGEPGYYFGNLVQLGVTRQFHPKFRYDVGLDFAWSGETKLKYQEAKDRYEAGTLETSLETYSPWKSTHIAASAMFEVLYNRFAFCIGGGYYLYHGIFSGTNEKKTWALAERKMSIFEKQYLPNAYKNYYERLGFKYYFGQNRNIYAGAFMKVHMDSIDYIEWTVGMNLFSWHDKKTTSWR